MGFSGWRVRELIPRGCDVGENCIGFNIVQGPQGAPCFCSVLSSLATSKPYCVRLSSWNMEPNVWGRAESFGRRDPLTTQSI